MKTLLNSVRMAFSMFSVIPSGRLEWTKDNMRYMLCALPLVGAVIGAVSFLIGGLCRAKGLDPLLTGALMTAAPAILSGGIHLDGFCDTADALASHADPEKMREIMKDSRAGAFAIIALCVYMMLYLAACTALADLRLILICPVLARSIGALGSTLFQGTGKEGLLTGFRENASAKTFLILLVWIGLCLFSLALIHPLYMAVSAAGAWICLLLVKHTADKKFHGMSGDLAGYLIALTELFVLLFCAIAGGIGGLA